MSADGAAAAAQSQLLTVFGEEHFNSERNDRDELSSAPMPVGVRPSRQFADHFLGRLSRRAKVNASDVRAVLLSVVSVEVMGFQGDPLMVYSTSRRMQPVKPQTVQLSDVDTLLGWAKRSLSGGVSLPMPDITLTVDRRFPLSSSHGNQPFIFTVVLRTGDATEVMKSDPFRVQAKRPKKTVVHKAKAADAAAATTHRRKIHFKAVQQTLRGYADADTDTNDDTDDDDDDDGDIGEACTQPRRRRGVSTSVAASNKKRGAAGGKAQCTRAALKRVRRTAGAGAGAGAGAMPTPSVGAALPSVAVAPAASARAGFSSTSSQGSLTSAGMGAGAGAGTGTGAGAGAGVAAAAAAGVGTATGMSPASTAPAEAAADDAAAAVVATTTAASPSITMPVALGRPSYVDPPPSPLQHLLLPTNGVLSLPLPLQVPASLHFCDSSASPLMHVSMEETFPDEFDPWAL